VAWTPEEPRAAFTPHPRRSLAQAVEDAGGAAAFVELVGAGGPSQPPREARRRPRPSPPSRPIPRRWRGRHDLEPWELEDE
jgi:hypothetical protein